MAGYVARRVLSAVPVLFLVTLIAFGIMQIVPGDPAMIIAGLGATPQEVARVRAQLGLDQPWHIQLARWYQGLARGDLGDSLLLGRSVSRALISSPVTTLVPAATMSSSVSGPRLTVTGPPPRTRRR